MVRQASFKGLHEDKPAAEVQAQSAAPDRATKLIQRASSQGVVTSLTPRRLRLRFAAESQQMHERLARPFPSLVQQAQV